MTTVTGQIFAEYNSFTVQSDPDVFGSDLDAMFAGQSNGICAAVVPGYLYFSMGTHYGPIGVTVEVHEGRPEIDDSWEEIVEVAFAPATVDVRVCSQMYGSSFPPFRLELTDYRLRVAISGMGEAASADFDPDRAVERCLLQFWPAPLGPDVVVKATSVVAVRNHERARAIPPPPPPPTPEELAERRRQKELEEAEQHRRYLMREWGGRLPSDRLLAVGDVARGLVHTDAEVVHALDAAGPALQRTVARWAARRVYDRAGLAEVEWIAPALAALERGEPLPPPFDQPDKAWERLIADPDAPDTTMLGMDGRSGPCHQQAFALPSLRHAADSDPLRAALTATLDACAGYGIDYPELLADLRRTFPQLFT
ncbi:hypothetical protein [Tenggerimyces flavus]|uniref:Uncharacterized protein n=1 Tax=Tenggerimyces flavus TaxID=1708749 RepID=A0ABV7YAB5_9ACTN|nr:hypothetical protein [Tenggerimyces flavus]MBM7783765.1 hypothetical protein [Tenggerimyces flavus]